MEPIFIKKRIYELSQKEYLDNVGNAQLLYQYHLDKQNNIPLEQSEARELLIMGNEKLVFRILHDRFGIYELSKDIEEYSIGMIGLIKAVDTFDISRDVTFSTYATQVVVNQIRMEYRKRKKHYSIQNKTISIHEPVGENKDGDIFYFEDFLGETDDITDQLIHFQNIQEIQSNLQYLSDLERATVIYGYGLLGNDKLRQKEIADIIGTGQGYISRLMRSGYEKLRILCTPNAELTLDEIKFKQKLLRQSDNNDNNTVNLAIKK